MRSRSTRQEQMRVAAGARSHEEAANKLRAATKLAAEDKARRLARCREEIRELLRNGAPPNCPVTKMTIKVQVCASTPLDIRWVTTVGTPGQGHRKPKREPCTITLWE
jgi:hypothetical protein